MSKATATSKLIVILPALLVVGACETVRVPMNDGTDPTVHLTASGPALRGGTAVVDPEGPREERRIETGETLVLRGTTEDLDGGVQRVTVEGKVRVFCSSNSDGEVYEDETFEEVSRGVARVGDRAPVRRHVTLTLTQQDLTPLCPRDSAFVRSEGTFTAHGENAHGSVVETDEFVYY